MPSRKSSRRVVAKWQRRRDVHKKQYKNPFFQKKVSIISYFPTTILIYVLLIINVFFLTHLFFFSYYFKIHEVDVHGVDLEMMEIIREKTFEQLDQKRWGILPQYNKFVFHEGQLRREILNLVNYQEIEISIVDHSLKINLQEERGIVNWSHHSGTYTVNEQGVVLYKIEKYEPTIEYTNEDTRKFYISFLLGNDDTLLVYDNTQQEIEIGGEVATSEYISQLLYMSEYFVDLIETTIISYEIFTTVGSHVKINTYQGWYALINNESQEQIENDILRLKVLLDEKFKEDRSRVEYVDLRNGEKVFYK